MSPNQRASAARALTLLTEGDIELQGRMPWSSNATFLVTVTRGEECTNAIYKPHRGERPLWDFPDGLYVREVAAYEVSTALGWGIVPETVLRDDAPLGIGSLQRFVDADFEQHYFTLLEDQAWHDELRRMAVFDLVINNADRKGGHCLLAEDRIWGIDNGLAFHVQSKLRTVIWDFCGEPVPDDLRAPVARLATALPDGLEQLLGAAERDALARRAAAVAKLKRLPSPSPNSHAYPWPLV